MNFQIKPDWQPISTAPKDGTCVMVLVWNAQFREGGIKPFALEASWGPIPYYPDTHAWRTPGDLNCFIDDYEFIDEHHVSIDGRDHRLYRGSVITHWAPLWKVEVLFPDPPTVTKKQVTYQHG